MHYKIIAVDFDGTLCENMWPDIGLPNRGLITYLIHQQTLGNKVILWTCRTGEKLEAAVNWCTRQGLRFDAVNENLPEAIEVFGSDSRKIFADVYIDDRSDNSFQLPYQSATLKNITTKMRKNEFETEQVSLSQFVTETIRKIYSQEGSLKRMNHE